MTAAQKGGLSSSTAHIIQKYWTGPLSKYSSGDSKCYCSKNVTRERRWPAIRHANKTMYISHGIEIRYIRFNIHLPQRFAWHFHKKLLADPQSIQMQPLNIG